jgi:hypothetical protein
MARQMALDAGAGRVAVQRLVLSLLDAECEREDQPAPERNEAEPFSLVQGESQGGGEDSTEAARQMEGYPSPAMEEVSTAIPASLSHKGRGDYPCVAGAKRSATFSPGAGKNAGKGKKSGGANLRRSCSRQNAALSAGERGEVDAAAAGTPTSAP